MPEGEYSGFRCPVGNDFFPYVSHSHLDLGNGSIEMGME